MQNKPISDLVAAFDQQSDRVRACLTDLLGTVGEGRVPSREAMSGLDSSVAELRTRYDAVYAMTRDTVSAGELPQDGAPVGELADAVENCRARYLDRQLKRAADILEKFTGVRSLIREYAAALAPYQPRRLRCWTSWRRTRWRSCFPGPRDPSCSCRRWKRRVCTAPQAPS